MLRPTDPTWGFAGLVELTRFGLNLGIKIANLPELPTWHPGDELLPARQKSCGR